MSLTKHQVLELLNEIGLRFVLCGDANDNLPHYKHLGIAFGVAYHTVQNLSDDEVAALATVIEQLRLGSGSTQ
jgi:hypothetical protein